MFFLPRAASPRLLGRSLRHQMALGGHPPVGNAPPRLYPSQMAILVIPATLVPLDTLINSE
jgi:hypothetical protein